MSIPEANLSVLFCVVVDLRKEDGSSNLGVLFALSETELFRELAKRKGLEFKSIVWITNIMKLTVEPFMNEHQKWIMFLLKSRSAYWL